jgi:hypothetical protein
MIVGLVILLGAAKSAVDGFSGEWAVHTTG